MADHKATASDTGDDVRDLLGARELAPRSLRRDPRADPDDDPTSGRVDVVTMDRGGSGSHAPAFDSVQNAALSFRREIAKLHQQAAAFERAIEDQRRERSDALDRIESANARVAEYEQRFESVEKEADELRRLLESAREELESARHEREQLKLSLEDANEARGELSRARANLETLRRERDEARADVARIEAALAEVREHERDETKKGQAEIESLRERLVRSNAELETLRGEVSKSKEEAANGASEIERLGKAIAEARAVEEKLASVKRELAAAKVDAAEKVSQIGRLERELETTRAARDASIERASTAERTVEDVRREAARVQSDLDAALSASAGATTRALTAERAKANVEESVRQLREELTSAFTKWRTAVPSVPPPPAAEPSVIEEAPVNFRRASVAPASMAPPPAPSVIDDTQNVHDALTLLAIEPAPETPRKATSFPPPVAEARPFSMRPESIAPTPLLDEDWVMDSRPPPPRPPPPLPANTLESVTITRSAPPPPSRSALPPVASGSQSSLPAVRTPSVAPPPVASVAPAAASVPPPAAASVPPAAASVPPPAAASVPPVAVSEPPATVAVPKVSERPVSALPKSREALFELLGDPAQAREAAIELKDHPEWLRGRPPLELLMALSHLDYDVDAPLFEVARSWENEPLSRALVAGLRDEPDPKLREHAAWLLKHLGSPGAWPALAELVTNDSEPTGVRRWLLEAIERLVATHALGWRDVGDLVHLVIRNPDATLRDGVIGVVAALERSDDKRRMLLEVLRTDDDERVLSSAVQALTTALPIVLDPAVAEHLLGHPSPRVQQSVVEFIERSKRSAKN